MFKACADNVYGWIRANPLRTHMTNSVYKEAKTRLLFVLNGCLFHYSVLFSTLLMLPEMRWHAATEPSMLLDYQTVFM